MFKHTVFPVPPGPHRDPNNPKKRVLLIDFTYTWLRYFKHLKEELARRYELVWGMNMGNVFRFLVQNPRHPLSAILVWDPSVMAANATPELMAEPTGLLRKIGRDNAHILISSIGQFAANGGTVIFCREFAHFGDPNHFGRFFQGVWALPWEAHEDFKDHRNIQVEQVLNKDSDIKISKTMPTKYAGRARCLSKVDRKDLVYVDENPSEKADYGVFVFARFHHGKVGYIGDLDNTKESHYALYAMIDE